MRKSNLVFKGYEMGPAPFEDDVRQEVYRFYEAPGKPGTVFARPRHIMDEAIEAGRCITGRNKAGDLVASSFLHVLAQGKEIETVTTSDGKVCERGRVGEIAGLYQHGDTPNADNQLPREFWFNPLVGWQLVNLLKDNETHVDLVMCSVFAQRENTIMRFTGDLDPPPTPPFHFKMFSRARELKVACLDSYGPEAMLSLGSKDQFLQSFRAPLTDLLSAARSIQDWLDVGVQTHAGDDIAVMQNRWGAKMLIDFSRLPIETVRDIVSHHSFPLFSEPPAKVRNLGYRPPGFDEARRAFFNWVAVRQADLVLKPYGKGSAQPKSEVLRGLITGSRAAPIEIEIPKATTGNVDPDLPGKLMTGSSGAIPAL